MRKGEKRKNKRVNLRNKKKRENKPKKFQANK